MDYQGNNLFNVITGQKALFFSVLQYIYSNISIPIKHSPM